MSGSIRRLVTRLFIAFGLPAATAALADVPRYTVLTDERLGHLDVRACFDGVLPRRLSAASERAPQLLEHVRLQTASGTRTLKIPSSTLVLPRVTTPACLHYRVDLGAIDRRQWRSVAWRTQGAILIDPGLWLWLPEGMGNDERVRLAFKLPPDFDVSAPWKRNGRDDSDHTVTFEVRQRMPGWEARTAIGRFSVETIELPGGRLRYALLPAEPAADAEFLRRWITDGARALASTYGRLPVPDVQLLVVPIGQGDEAVPWGEVLRGGGDAVHLYVDQRQSEDEFRDDWVLIHELSHLLHPFIDSRDRWLPEGIASYYQNVLRARAGLKSPQYAWDRLHAGFVRGIRGTPSGRSLAEVSETMMRDRSFMRVYWSGAAIALLADVELRRRSAGAQSLDSALAALGDCCLPADRSWTALELMQTLDRVTESTVFTDLYHQHVDSDEFPDLGAVYTRLGLQPISATRLRLDTDAEDAAICAAIMAVSDE